MHVGRFLSDSLRLSHDRFAQFLDMVTTASEDECAASPGKVLRPVLGGNLPILFLQEKPMQPKKSLWLFAMVALILPSALLTCRMNASAGSGQAPSSVLDSTPLK